MTMFHSNKKVNDGEEFPPRHCWMCKADTELSTFLHLCANCLESYFLKQKESHEADLRLKDHYAAAFTVITEREVQVWHELAKLIPTDEYLALVDKLFKNPIAGEKH